MLLYMIKSSGGNYLVGYQQIDADNYTAKWSSTASNGKVFLSGKKYRVLPQKSAERS